MGLKEIITYVGFIIGFALVIYIRVHYASRQKITPDNQYSPFEQRFLNIAYGILIVTFILACIPIY